MTSTGPLADEQTHDYAFCLAALRGALSELRDFLPTVLAAIPDGETLMYGASGSAFGALRRGQFPAEVLSPDLDDIDAMHDFVLGCVALTTGCRDVDEAITLLMDRFPPSAVRDGDVVRFLSTRRDRNYVSILKEIATYVSQLLLALNARTMHEIVLEQQRHREGQVGILKGLVSLLE